MALDSGVFHRTDLQGLAKQAADIAGIVKVCRVSSICGGFPCASSTSVGVGVSDIGEQKSKITKKQHAYRWKFNKYDDNTGYFQDSRDQEEADQSRIGAKRRSGQKKGEGSFIVRIS